MMPRVSMPFLTTPSSQVMHAPLPPSAHPVVPSQTARAHPRQYDISPISLTPLHARSFPGTQNYNFAPRHSVDSSALAHMRQMNGNLLPSRWGRLPITFVSVHNLCRERARPPAVAPFQRSAHQRGTRGSTAHACEHVQ